MPRNENFTLDNVGIRKLVKYLGNRSTAYRLITSLRGGVSFRCETGAITEWACHRCAPLVVVGLLGLSIGWSTSAALAGVDVLERSYNHFRTGTNAAESIPHRPMSTPVQTSSTDAL